jgi:methyl-accepting chemotaxis protein
VQLEHIRETFVTAVEGIANNLRHIGVNVADISGDIQKITGDNGRNRKTFISEMEGMLSSVNASFNIIIKNADASRKLLDRMLLLSSNVKEEVAKFITDIEEIAFNIKLIAFNTEIKSSQIGKEGFALEVVADRIQQLSRETSEKAETVSEMLRIITASADELSSGITAAVQGSSDEVVKISGELEILEKTFSALNKNIVPLLSEIDMNAHDLSGDIQRLTEGINVHIVFDERVKRAVSELNAISLHSEQLLLEVVKPEGESYRHANQSFHRGPFKISEMEFLSGIHIVPESVLIAENDIQKKSVNNTGNSIEFF